MTTSNATYSSYIASNLENVLHRTSTSLKTMGQGLADVNTLIMHAKIVEAYNSVAETFFSVQMPFADNLKGALKTLKGWNALGSLPSQVISTSEAIYSFVKKAAFTGFIDCVQRTTVVINKTYDAASFLEKQIAVPFFQGVTDSYRTTHFGALLVGSTTRFIGALDRVFDRKWNLQVSGSLKVAESLSSMVFAGSILMGGSNQLTTAASAVSAFSKGAEYFWTKCL